MVLDIGERAPDFVARGPSGQPARFYAHAGGRPTAVVFGAAPQLAELVGARDDLAMCQVSRQAADDVWVDPDGRVAQVYGVGDEPAVVVLDPNLRVAGVVTGEADPARVLELLAATLHRDPAPVVTAQAPVLLLPGALPPDWCRRLIDVWHGGSVATGVERAAGEELDDGYKRRRDHTVEDPELMRDISTVVGRRVMPEVRKAFAFQADRFEGFKIACYDARTGGFFRPHRDNLTRSTAHRVFALTLNLNEEYEGGQLRFPEYGNHLYRPDAGAALVFSCSQLHEVMPVTAGQRFVLLSFLYRGDPPDGQT